MKAFRWRGLISVAIACSLFACGSDDPVHTPVEYLLCAGVRPGGWIGVFDCKNDSLVDSLGYPGMLAPWLYASSTGKYVASAESGRPTRIWDLRSRTQAGELESPEQVLFLDDRDALLTSNHIDTVKTYSIPGFAVDTSIWLRLSHPVRLAAGALAVGVRLRGRVDFPADQSQIAVIELNTLKLVDSFTVDDGSEPVQFRWIEPSRDGSVLYLLGADWSSPSVIAYSLRDHRVVFRTNLYSALGSCKLSPDQRELWVTDPGPPPTFGEAWPGHVLILNATTGAILDTIHTRGLDDEFPDIRWRVDDIQFVPGQDKAYVNCLYRGPILVIDTKSKEITRFLLHDEGRSADGIVVLPRY